MSKTQIPRPWQGTILGLLMSLLTIMTTLAGIASLAAQKIFFSMFGSNTKNLIWYNVDEAADPTEVFQTFMIIFGVVMLLLVILNYLIARDIFRGKKWSLIGAIIIALLFYGLAMYSYNLTVALVSAIAFILAVFSYRNAYYE